MKEYLESSIFPDKRKNSLLCWLLVFYLLATSVFLFLDGDVTWSIYGLLAVSLVAVPALVSGDRLNMVPFEIVLLLAAPFTLKSIEIGFVPSRTLTYLSAAALALLVVSELDSFTSFRTTPRFSTYLVTVATVAFAGIWAVMRWLSDIYFGTSVMPDEHILMWEFTASILAGIVAGEIFRYYFERRDRRLKA